MDNRYINVAPGWPIKSPVQSSTQRWCQSILYFRASSNPGSLWIQRHTPFFPSSCFVIIHHFSLLFKNSRLFKFIILILSLIIYCFYLCVNRFFEVFWYLAFAWHVVYAYSIVSYCFALFITISLQSDISVEYLRQQGYRQKNKVQYIFNVYCTFNKFHKYFIYPNILIFIHRYLFK